MLTEPHYLQATSNLEKRRMERRGAKKYEEEKRGKKPDAFATIRAATQSSYTLLLHSGSEEFLPPRQLGGIGGSHCAEVGTRSSGLGDPTYHPVVRLPPPPPIDNLSELGLLEFQTLPSQVPFAQNWNEPRSSCLFFASPSVRARATAPLLPGSRFWQLQLAGVVLQDICRRAQLHRHPI